jgi:hypothetical protein
VTAGTGGGESFAPPTRSEALEENNGQTKKRKEQNPGKKVQESSLLFLRKLLPKSFGWGNRITPVFEESQTYRT